MDSYDERNRSHPSQSIPNAAYPDSSYRPNDELNELHFTPTTSSSPSIMNPPQLALPSPASTKGPSPHSPSYAPLLGQHSSAAAGGPAPPPPPMSPPPPYESSRSPIAYSPLDAPSASSHAQHVPLSPRYEDPHSPSPSPNPYSVGGDSTEVKLGPVAEARRRRKRKLGVLLVVLCSVLMFLIALIVGIALGVLRVGKDHDGGNGGGSHGGGGDDDDDDPFRFR